MRNYAIIPGRTVFSINFFNFLLYGSIGILLSYFPVYFKAIGFSTFIIGIIMGVGPFVSIFANPFWGYWSDKTQNIKRVIMIMMVGNLFVIQFVFHIHILPIVFCVMFLFFFFQQPMFSQSNSLILNTIEGTNKKFGAFRMWGSLGWALMTVAAGPILDWLGILNIWIVYTIMLLLTFGLSFFLPKGYAPDTVKPEKINYFKTITKNKYFLAFILLGVLVSVPNMINQTFVSLYIDYLGGSSVMIGWSVFLMAILEVPVFLILDRYLSQKIRTMFFLLIIVAFLFCLRWFLMFAAVSPVQLIFIQLLHSITFGGYYYIGTILTARLIPANLRASGQAIFALTWGGISGMIAGLSGGWMFESIGPSTMYLVTTVISFLGFLGFVVLFLKIRQANPHEM